tara:strand:+ start:117 stop:242 length:126 start_codon:yes stop_codon:yes gene_type:complete
MVPFFTNFLWGTMFLLFGPKVDNIEGENNIELLQTVQQRAQ